MGGYIEPGLPLGDPPRTPPYVCVTITARHAADYSLRSFVMFFIDVTTCIFTINIHDTNLTRRFQAKLCRVPAPLWSCVWSALMRALPLRLCAPVLVLTGAECSDLLRSGSDWLRLIFCCQTMGHIVHSLL